MGLGCHGYGLGPVGSLGCWVWAGAELGMDWGVVGNGLGVIKWAVAVLGMARGANSGVRQGKARSTVR